jgi:anthranilate synthase component 1
MYHPTREEFKELAQKGNMIPVFCEVNADTETAVSAFRKLAYHDGKTEKYAFLLESVEEGKQVGRYSFLGIQPEGIIVHKNNEGTFIKKDGQKEKLSGSDIFERVQSYLGRYKSVKVLGLAPFCGGAVGFNGFEVIEEIEPSVKTPEKDVLNVPDAVFMIISSLLAFDHVKNRIQVITHAQVNEYTDLDWAYDHAIEKLQEMIGRLNKTISHNVDILPTDVTPLPFSSNKTEEEFHSMVNKVKKYVYDGDIIQCVISQRFEAELEADPLTVHRALRMVNPSPYMFCLHLDGMALVGASPEIHAQCQNGKMMVCPIAGTRKRGKDIHEDLAMEKELLADEKERAEHIMLVDLARNDLGRIAEEGTVKVPDLMRIERYSHVMHIVSDVTGTIRDEHQSNKVMSATFPAGTLSGAPKIRAMQIISELEQERRGPYGGTVVYFSFDGNIDSCITIRSALLKDGKAYVQSGAGIVADSVPELEYKETINKAKGMMTALALAEKLS